MEERRSEWSVCGTDSEHQSGHSDEANMKTMKTENRELEITSYKD